MTAPTFDQIERTRLAALRLLEVRARSRAELTDRLLARKLPRHAVTEVVERLCEVGLVNDVQLAADLVEQETGARPAGEALLRHRLERHRVADAAAETALESVEEPERERALRLARSVALRLPPALDRAACARRLLSALARRGFDEDTAREAAEATLDALGLDADPDA